MKKTFALLIILITFLGCSSNDSDYIEGSWKVKSYTIKGTTSENLDECDANSLYVFNSDGHFISSGAQVNTQGENCMFSWAIKWRKEADYYLVYEQYGNTIIDHARLTKINKNSIRVEYITNNSPDLKKTLVRQ